MPLTKSKNPFKTERTTISAATPNATPAADIAVIREIKDTDRGLVRYRLAMSVR